MKLFVVLALLLGSPLPANSQSSDIHAVAERSQQEGIERSLDRYPNFAVCHDGKSPRDHDLKWGELYRRSDLWVCFYHLMMTLKTEDELRRWLAQYSMDLLSKQRNEGARERQTLAFVCRIKNEKCPLNWRRLNASFLSLPVYSVSVTINRSLSGVIDQLYLTFNRQ